MKTPDIIRQGKDNGEGMVIHYQTSKGTDIFGLGILNLWGGEGWDLGPTWCYLVLGQKTVLIDTGRFGNFEILKNLLGTIDIQFSDIEAIIVTHSHEDHDGNLPEILEAAQPELWAHTVYPCMIAYHPHITDGANHPELPGSCRFCFMAEEFYQTCISYHQKRSKLKVDRTLDEGTALPIEDLQIVHTPGHTPDSICVILDNEAIFTGDTVLPDITPHPSSAHIFATNRRILPEQYQQRNMVYGLMAYINSLSKLAALDENRFSATFPAHRLFYHGQFNLIDSLGDRAREIIQFHIDRCSDILRIVKDQPRNLDEIAIEHFLPSQLAGSGKLMSRSELTAHFEVMESNGDIRWVGEDNDLVEHTGSYRYLEVLGAYLM